MKLQFSRQSFENTLISNFMTFRPMGPELFQAERRKTDVTKLTVAFRKLSNTPKAFLPF
jgi:hypothetical protein